MISLKGPTSHTRVFESQPESISESSGGTVLALQHNFGSTPDAIECFVFQNGEWKIVMDWMWASQNWGWYNLAGTDTPNTSYVTVFVVLGGTNTFKFKCYKFNTIHRNFEPFKWEEREQVWPFESGPNGETLYCQKKDLGALPNAGIKQVSLNTTIDAYKIHKYWGIAKAGVSNNADVVSLPYVSNAYSSHYVLFTAPNSSFYMHTGVDWTSYSGIGYVIYWK